MRRNLLLLLMVTFLVPIRAAAQAPPVNDDGHVLTRADSVRALRSARGAQRRFELLRRSQLPWTFSSGAGPCDERIGRFCLWYSSGGRPWQPPPDPEAVVRGRFTLIGELGDASRILPSDAWIAGQRVRYLVEADEAEQAIDAARDCRATEPGWCMALLGYAFHSANDFVAADSAFAAALDQMPPDERDRWTDLSVLLEHGDVRGYRRLPLEERAEFEARFWWLADPLYLVDGNDRRTEHFVRHVTDRLQDRARSTEGISWGWDLRELLIRYGSPAGWERIRPDMLGAQETRIITRYRHGSRRFAPPRAFVDQPQEIEPDAWDLNPRRARSAYAPMYADSLVPLDHQLAVFRRGDSLRIVAALQTPADSAGNRGPASAGLVFMRDWNGERVMRISRGQGSVVLDLVAPHHAGVVSIEALGEDPKLAGRERYGVSRPPLQPGEPALSDLLIHAGGEPEDESLDAILSETHSTLRFQVGESIGLFWEIYGLARATETVQVSIQLLDRNAGLLRRLATRAGLVREQQALMVRWREHAASRFISRSLSLEIPQVGAGRYEIELTVTVPGREPLRATRVIYVEEAWPG